MVPMAKEKQVNFLASKELADQLKELQEKKGDSFKLSGWLREVVASAVKRELSALTSES